MKRCTPACQTLVDVVDLFKVNIYAPGNWDYVYSKNRFTEFFAATISPAAPASKRWGALTANLYHAGVTPAAMVLPPTNFIMLNSLKIGIIGCTTNRGPQVLGSWVTEGLTFTDCAARSGFDGDAGRARHGRH